MDQKIQIQFVVSRSELACALGAINDALPRIRLIRRIAWTALVIAMILTASGVLAPETALLIAFIPALAVFLLWLTPRYLARTIWKNSPFWASQQTWELTPAGLACVSGGIETQTSWAAITRTVETADFVLFFGSEQSAHFIPKRALSPGSVAAVRAMANDRVGRESGEYFRTRERSAPLVEATFEIDPVEIGRAGMVAARKTGSLWIWYGIMAIIVAWNTVPAVYSQWLRGGLAGISVPVLLLGLVPLAVILVAPPLAARWAARRYIRTAPSAKGPQSVGVADWGLRISGPLYSGTLEWSAFMRVDESSEFFLFFVAKLQPVFIPKRVLSAEGIARVRTLIRAGMGGKARILAA